MSYSRRQLEALGEPFGDSATQKKLGGGYICGFGGGGGSPPPPQPDKTTVVQSNIPDWAVPYATKVLGKSEALTESPYQQYKDPRIAGFTPQQTSAMAGIAGMTPAPQLGTATGMAGLAGLSGLGAGGRYAAGATSPTAMSSYMSPYMQNVVDYQKSQAILDYGRALPGMNAQAVGQRAYGGTRQALVTGEAQRNLYDRLAGIQATGSQQAFDNARQQMQFGANLGLTGDQLAGQQATTLGQLGQQQFTQGMGITDAQLRAGAMQQDLAQRGLTEKYQDFQAQQQNPYTQLGYMSNILRGVPVGGSTTQVYQAPPSTLAQLSGLGLGAYSLGKLG